MSFLHFRVERVWLPHPDLLMVNHPEQGLVLIADPRVDDDTIDRLIQVCEARAGLHPERMRPDYYADGAAAVPAQRAVSRSWPLALYARYAEVRVSPC